MELERGEAQGRQEQLLEEPITVRQKGRLRDDLTKQISLSKSLE